jgi:putative ABC transport system permease protein
MPDRAGEVVTGYRARLGARLTLSSTERARTVTVVGIARPRTPVTRGAAIFLTDTEAARLAGHPGQVDAIGVLAGSGFNLERVRSAAHGAQVVTGAARGRVESPQQEEGRTRLIAVAASFGGLGVFVALFVLTGTMALSVQQREQEMALLRAVAATPGQIRRMITWEATVVALAGSAAGIWPGEKLGFELRDGLIRHGIAPPGFTVTASWLHAAAVIAGGIAVALLAVRSAGRRASRVSPTRALADAAVEPGGLGRGRLIGGAAPLFAVASTTRAPETAAATSEMTAMFLVTAVGFLGPAVARIAASVLAPVAARLSPVGGFLASANLGTATRRFSSATTPIVLTVAMSCTLLFSTTTLEHVVSTQRDAGVSADLALSSRGAGLPPAAFADVRATQGVKSAVALTPTTLGPSLGVSDETIPAQILAGHGGGLDIGVTAGTLSALHGNAIALGQHRADAAHARVGGQVPVVLGDGSRAHPTVVAIYKRDLGFGDAMLAPELAAAHQTNKLVGMILVRTGDPTGVSMRLHALASRYPGLQVQDRAALASATDVDRETNKWLGPLFVVMIFVFTSIAVVNTLVMIALRRGRELALLQLTGATRRQVRAMARWEAVLIIVIGLGVGLAIAATALLPLSHALTGNVRPTIPAGQLAAILGVSALLALVALTLPTHRAMRTRPIQAVGSTE